MAKSPFTQPMSSCYGRRLFAKILEETTRVSFTIVFRELLKKFVKSINVLLIDPNKNSGPILVLKVCFPLPVIGTAISCFSSMLSLN